MIRPPEADALPLEDMLPVAADLAVRAGRRVMELLKDPLVKQRKADHSIVTNADHASNDILRRGLRSAFPAHLLLSEETGLEGPSGADCAWLIDPLDGTRAYVRGGPGFSVMLGLLFRGRPVLGVVYDPWEDHLYEAARGLGAFHTHGDARTAARVSGRARAEEWPVASSTGFPDALRSALAASLPGPWLAPVNSVGVKVGLLVRGAADVYVNHHGVHSWDTAGPQAILEEAGGRITLWDGTPLRYDLAAPAHPGPTLATHGPAHDALLPVLTAFSRKA